MERFQKLLSYIFAAIVGILMASCHEHEPSPDPGPNPEPMPGRTILVYQVANNNLGSGNYDQKDIDEMLAAAQAGHFGNNRLILYHHAYRKAPVLKEISAHGIDTLLEYNTDLLSVSAERMTMVIDDMKSLAPAKSYGLVLWSHATGWLQDGIKPEAQSASPASQAPASSSEPTLGPGAAQSPMRSFGLDGTKRMDITTLASVLEGKGFDFVYFDCCFMGSVETLYELRRVAPVMIASACEVPVKGMPYHSTLQHLFNAKDDYAPAARSTFEHYDSTYMYNFDCPNTMAVVRTEHLDEVAAATREIYVNAEASRPSGYSPQALALNPCYYYDFQDYVETLAARWAQESDESAAQAVQALERWHSAYSKLVEYSANSSHVWGEIAITRFGGLSTYIFRTTEDQYFTKKNYAELSWYADVASALVR